MLRPYIESGAPVYLKPLHLDYFSNLEKFREAEAALNNPQIEDNDKEEKPKKKKKKKKKKKASNPDEEK